LLSFDLFQICSGNLNLLSVNVLHLHSFCLDLSNSLPGLSLPLGLSYISHLVLLSNLHLGCIFGLRLNPLTEEGKISAALGIGQLLNIPIVNIEAELLQVHGNILDELSFELIPPQKYILDANIGRQGPDLTLDQPPDQLHLGLVAELVGELRVLDELVVFVFGADGEHDRHPEFELLVRHGRHCEVYSVWAQVYELVGLEGPYEGFLADYDVFDEQACLGDPLVSTGYFVSHIYGYEQASQSD
jgi:hypothetical protein